MSLPRYVNPFVLNRVANASLLRSADSSAQTLIKPLSISAVTVDTPSILRKALAELATQKGQVMPSTCKLCCTFLEWADAILRKLKATEQINVIREFFFS